MKISSIAARAVRAAATANKEYSAQTTASPIWTVPDSRHASFSTILRDGDWMNLEWSGGLANDTGDLWLVAWDYASYRFAQLLTKQVDLSADGAFNWTVRVPQVQLEATPQYALTLKTARADYQFNSSDPGRPSRGIFIVPAGFGRNPTNGTLTAHRGTHADDEESESEDESDDESDESDDDDVARTHNATDATDTTMRTSVDATCGGNVTCLGSAFGNCCSQHNYCGSSSAYCGAGCLSGFGSCDEARSSTTAASAASNSTGLATVHHSGVGVPAAVAAAISVSVVGLGILVWFWLRRHQNQRRLQALAAATAATAAATAAAKEIGDDSDAASMEPHPINTATSTASTPAVAEFVPVFEMPGGEKPFVYGRSAPVELLGSTAELAGSTVDEQGLEQRRKEKDRADGEKDR